MKRIFISALAGSVALTQFAAAQDDQTIARPAVHRPVAIVRPAPAAVQRPNVNVARPATVQPGRVAPRFNSPASASPAVRQAGRVRPSVTTTTSSPATTATANAQQRQFPHANDNVRGGVNNNSTWQHRTGGNQEWRNRTGAGVTQTQNRQVRNRSGAGAHHEWRRDWDRNHHDRNWWREHYTRFVLFGGGYYYWNDGFWYPAYGYDPYYSTYVYDAPIYAYNDMAPGQVMATVQQELARLGYYNGAIDGTYGPLTQSALLSYQQSVGLAMTGVIDQATLESLGLA